MSLLRVSPLNHQSQFTRVTADFQYNALDNAVNQNKKRYGVNVFLGENY